MGKKSWRLKWMDEFAKCKFIPPSSEMELPVVVQNLTDLLYGLQPGEYQIRVHVTNSGRYTLPSKHTD
jgi:hypothetical protein